MNRLTLKALRGSIKKWEGIVAGSGVDNGADNCPLCTRFFGRDCNGCPVSEKSGQDGCRNTPYMLWLETQETNPFGEYNFPLVANTDLRRSAARSELSFLKNLLP